MNLNRWSTNIIRNPILAVFGLLILGGCQAGSGRITETVPVSPTPAPVTAAPTNTEINNEPPTEIPRATAAATPTKVPAPLSYQIVLADSEIRFYIDEVLFGEPKTVIGRTQNISGEILLDMDFPDEAQLGTIQVDALSLTTDNSFRNRALRSQILESNQDRYQYIYFEPLGIEGLPDAVELGEPLQFLVTGNLTIRETVSPVTFEMQVTPVSETEIGGSGSAIVLRETFGLEIPQVTGVAQVSEEVRLEIDFVARAGP